jgi:hypothetical protein
MALFGKFARRERWDAESGQALTEFVVVFPLFMLVIIFCIWLWEIGHVRLKLNEAVRYATWEATAYRLHDYNKKTSNVGLELLQVLQTPFNAMRASVMGKTFIRYVDLDSSQMGVHTGRTVASWGPPQIWFPEECGAVIGSLAELAGKSQFCGNEAEELLPGGQAINLVARLAGIGFTVAQAMSLKKMNPIAQALIQVGGTTGFSGRTMPGKTPSDKAIPYGSASSAIVAGWPHWNFNQKGYVHVYGQIAVQNDWFNVEIFGEPLFPRRGVVLRAHYSLMADSWRLNQSLGDYDNKTEEDIREEMAEKAQRQMKRLEEQQKGNRGLLNQAWGAVRGTFGWVGKQYGKLTGSQPLFGEQYDVFSFDNPERGGYWNEVNRLYFATPAAKVTALSFIQVFKQIADMALFKIPALTALATGLTDDDFLYPSLVVKRYKIEDGSYEQGVVRRDEDKGEGIYHTLPFEAEHQETFEQRGKYYDGCKDQESMGCGASLSSDRAWGSQISRH